MSSQDKVCKIGVVNARKNLKNLLNSTGYLKQITIICSGSDALAMLVPVEFLEEILKLEQPAPSQPFKVKDLNDIPEREI